MTAAGDGIDGLSRALKEFHRALIRAEIGDDPALENPYTMLFALIGDPRLAWMRTLSGLIARIDQQADGDEPPSPELLRGLADEAAALLGEGPLPPDEGFRLRHLLAIQKEPDVGLATGRLRRALSALR